MKRIARILLLLAAATAAGLWLVYLTPSRGGAGSDTIRFSFWGDWQEYRMWKRVVEEFGDIHPEIRIQIEYIPGGGEYARKLTAWLAADAAPDVMLLQDEPFPRYLAKSDTARPVLADLTKIIGGETLGSELAVRAEDYWPTAWRSFGRGAPDGWHQYGLPVFGGNNLILYNRECFRRAGVPLPEESDLDRDWTTDDFMDLCRKLTIREGPAGRRRTVQWGFDRPWGWLYWLPFVYACDAEILNEDRTEFVFTGPEALRSLQLWDQLGREGLVPRGGELGRMSQNAAFLTGRVAMVCQGPWLMPFLNANPNSNAAGVDYGVMFPPKSPTGRRGTHVTWSCVGLAGRLATQPHRLEMAYRFARFVASAEAADVFAEVQRSVPAHRAGRSAFIAGSDPTRAAKFVAAMQFARLQPITIKWEDMDDALRNDLAKLTNEKLTPSATLERMAQSMVRRGLFPVRLPDGTLTPAEGGP